MPNLKTRTSKRSASHPKGGSERRGVNGTAPASVNHTGSVAVVSGIVKTTVSPSELSVVEGLVRELVRLARDQGFLTRADIKDAAAEVELAPEHLPEIFSRLRSLEIERTMRGGETTGACSIARRPS